MNKPKIVILGAGYAGLKTAKQLQKKNVNAEIILVNKNEYHYESTQLHEVAAGTEPGSKISFNIADVIDSNKVTFIQDEVTLIKKEEKKVILAKKGEISYDYLVIALGFESETFGIPGVNEFSKPLVDIKTAEAARQYLDTNLANYAKSKNEADLSIAVCGAGFTSIEYLGEITNRIPKLAEKLNFPADKVKITCIEAMPTLLPMFSEKLGTYGIDVLKKRGVNFIVGTPIKEIKENTVVYEQEGELKELTANTVIWTTGVRGSAVVGESGFDERRGRVVVESDLSVAGFPEVFMIGDVSAVMDGDSGRPFPTTAQIALQQGAYLGNALAAKLNNQSVEAFTYKPLGTVASIGNNVGLGNVMGKEVKGYIGSIMKKNIINKSLVTTGGTKTLLKKGRFDYYH
ncbi:NAD(P)/FAD-dependent oxidoreductase [Vagococcus fluvialis]|jgi:NADH dehydrogenase|uniref:FAD-dependent oxidoreductase n=1 Tax=Vagococcus fluvialis TaxID=2738 RepID=A0A369B0L1_9ENTE|nr:NAD(P)/FAD-dependent oxidoreductase [Vagococcus fluvialis]MBO0443920.1 NAD(P)/FAD-dependent oxidoreductase [Vagococcus fluvialis]MBO0480364.1 NAD(P)/FAD-dependent oxidoreductase [Vagococcus fluvialis]MBO0485725.1 NAD(P)/FAD-dependent oxidoreductase [Vagococcus fluvialis]MBO0486725.1 NAD(P)/FAD-dependent oxidoreductase [Vagococcus fluvialis]MDT2747817.1 NAD(P)/FAD-dependent oxidoreductase [Vagococcus fluvialis]